MTSQNQALLQDVKNEYAKKHGFKYWDDRNHSLLFHVDELMQLYHTRLLAEAGKGLPSIERLYELMKSQQFSSKPGYIIIYEFLTEQASALLAAKQGEVDEFKYELGIVKGLYAESKAEVERLKGLINAPELNE